MYKNVEKAISDMEMTSKFMPSKMKPGKYNKNHMKNEDFSMVSPMAVSPLGMGCGLKDMNMGMMSMPMDVMQQNPNPMDMMQPMSMNADMMQTMPMNMDMIQPMPMNMMQNYPCEVPCPMPSGMMAPQMVPPCILNLYTAYPYLNPNR